MSKRWTDIWCKKTINFEHRTKKKETVYDYVTVVDWHECCKKHIYFIGPIVTVQ